MAAESELILAVMILVAIISTPIVECVVFNYVGHHCWMVSWLLSCLSVLVGFIISFILCGLHPVKVEKGE